MPLPLVAPKPISLHPLHKVFGPVTNLYLSDWLHDTFFRVGSGRAIPRQRVKCFPLPRGPTGANGIPPYIYIYIYIYRSR